MSWLWQGYLAPGNVTLLTSQWKTGKTTLLAVLLARMKAGGSLGGLTVAPGKALVICEESRQHWELRRQKLDFGNHVGWLCRTSRGRPGHDQWLALVDHVAALHARHGLHLIVLSVAAGRMARRRGRSGPPGRWAWRPVCVRAVGHQKRRHIREHYSVRLTARRYVPCPLFLVL
jgi:hypothetical protein